MMRKLHINVLASTALLLISGVVHALEYRSVVETGTLFYAAPNNASTKLFVVSRFYPVEIIAREGEWSRVRDAAGQVAWVNSAQLSSKRYVLALGPKVLVRAKDSATAEVLATVEKNVALELLAEPTSAWAKVRIDAKTSGYVRLQDVWGI